MNVSETLQILSALKACGAVHFKSQDFEVNMSPKVDCPLPLAELPPKAEPVPSPEPPVMNEDATEKLKGLIETLKMDDSALIDKIFPAGAGG